MRLTKSSMASFNLYSLTISSSSVKTSSRKALRYPGTWPRESRFINEQAWNTHRGFNAAWIFPIIAVDAGLFLVAEGQSCRARHQNGLFATGHTYPVPVWVQVGEKKGGLGTVAYRLITSVQWWQLIEWSVCRQIFKCVVIEIP